MKYFLSTLILAMLWISPSVAFADSTASFSFSNISKNIIEGKSATTKVMVNYSKSINAVSGVVNIPSSNLSDISISTDASIVSFWTKEPKLDGDKISFEGVIVGDPTSVGSGELFWIIYTPNKKVSVLDFSFNDGTIFANDGEGKNIISDMKSISILVSSDTPAPVIKKNISIKAKSPVVKKSEIKKIAKVETKEKEIIIKPEVVAVTPQLYQTPFIEKLTVPYITKYSPVVDQSDSVAIVGRGDPLGKTHIDFVDISLNSKSQQIINKLNPNRVPLESVDVVNNDQGLFSYVSPSNLIAGAYSAVPSLVKEDTAEHIPGTGVQIFIQDTLMMRIFNGIIKGAIFVLPFASLFIIIFIPLYYHRKMRLLVKKAQH